MLFGICYFLAIGKILGMPGIDSKHSEYSFRTCPPACHVNPGWIKISAKNVLAKVKNAFSVPALVPAVA